MKGTLYKSSDTWGIFYFEDNNEKQNIISTNEKFPDVANGLLVEFEITNNLATVLRFLDGPHELKKIIELYQFAEKIFNKDK